MNSPSLAELAIEAHGGLDRWRQFKTVSPRPPKRFKQSINGLSIRHALPTKGYIDDLELSTSQ